MVLKQGMGLVGVGVAIGLAAALVLTRVMRNMLYGVTHTDPLTIAGVVVLLLAVALVACYGPTRKATGVDPAETLHSE